MKKILFILLFGLTTIFAQSENNGEISFLFNGKKIDLPISSVTLTKHNDIVLSLRCEYDGPKNQQMIGFDIALKELSTNSSALLNEGTRININTRDKINSSGQDLTVWFGMDKNDARNVEGETANYSVFGKGQKANWQITSKTFKLTITKVNYDNKKLNITGIFSGSFSSTIAPKGKVAEIKDGIFKIII
jgi:hypothetical protein